MTVPPALAAVAAMSLEEYNPGLVIEAVNQLQPQGGDALATLEDFVSLPTAPDPAYGLFWVLRVLFDVPASAGFPTVAIGQPTVEPPDDPSRLPRFPVVVVHDVPLLVVRGYDLGGFPQPVQEHLEYFRTWGTVRLAPLSPPSSLDGLAEEFDRRWESAYDGAAPADGPHVVRDQLARLRTSP